MCLLQSKLKQAKEEHEAQQAASRAALAQAEDQKQRLRQQAEQLSRGLDAVIRDGALPPTVVPQLVELAQQAKQLQLSDEGAPELARGSSYQLGDGTRAIARAASSSVVTAAQAAKSYQFGDATKGALKMLGPQVSGTRYVAAHTRAPVRRVLRAAAQRKKPTAGVGGSVACGM